EVFAQINDWWRDNQEQGKASVLFAYSLGKAQRILAGIDCGIGPIYLNGQVARLVKDYRAGGVLMPPCTYVGDAPAMVRWDRALILAPPSVQGTAWLHRFGAHATGLASGWMAVRDHHRGPPVERGFVLSDHADWPGLMQAITATGARRILVTHGYIDPMVRHLRQQGFQAEGLATPFAGESEEPTFGAAP